MSMSSDEEAFAQRLEDQRKFLERYGRRLTRSADKSEELADRTIIKAWRYRDNFIENTKLLTWLVTILERLHINDNRSRKQRTRLLSLIGDDGSELEIPVAAQQENHMKLRFARECVAKLPNAERKAVELFLDGYGPREGAKKLNVKYVTFKSQQSRGLKTLREIGARIHGNSYGIERGP